MDNIIVFGYGNFCKTNEKDIRDQYIITAFVDNRVKTDVVNHVYNFKDVKFASDNKIMIMVYDFANIVQQLLSVGVDENNILIGLNYYGLSDKDAARRQIGRFRVKEKKIIFWSDLTSAQEIKTVDDIGKLDRLITRLKNPLPFDGARLGREPIDRLLGFGRGNSISRYYVDRFIDKNRKYIKGDVMEIGDSHYMTLYGDYISKEYVLHVNGGENYIKGDLQTGEGIEEEMLDCFICTQVLDFIYDLKNSCKNIVKALKKNGIALITVGGISQISRFDMDRWGHYWNFTDLSLKRLFADIVGEENIQVETYGNVKTAMMRLYGCCLEELSEEDLDYCDKDYQQIISAVVRKP